MKDREETSLQALSAALEAAGGEAERWRTLRAGGEVRWALLAARPERRWALWVEPESPPAGWQADLPSALCTAAGPWLCRATLVQLEGGGCLLHDGEREVSPALRSITERLLARYRPLLSAPSELEALRALPAVEAFEQARGLLLEKIIAGAAQGAARRHARQGPEVIARRGDLDGQAALHGLAGFIEGLADTLLDAYEDPRWQPQPPWED